MSKEKNKETESLNPGAARQASPGEAENPAASAKEAGKAPAPPAPPKEHPPADQAAADKAVPDKTTPGKGNGAEIPEGETQPESRAEPGPAQLLEAAKEEAVANYDRFLRVTAEFDNYKRRLQKEHADRLRYAMSPLIREIAGTVDNLELAMSHAAKGQDDGVQALLDGIAMVVKQIHEVFAKFGVTRIEASGQPFDPELHEAMTVVETADVPENQVIEEFQAGYRLHDRVVRPARVAVSKRPEKPTAGQ